MVDLKVLLKVDGKVAKWVADSAAMWAA